MSEKSKKSGFFAVDTDSWANVIDANSMNAAVAYLALCRGTGGDNSTTSWSTNAIEKYTNISRSRAKAAIKLLVEHDLIKQTKKSTRPQYKMRTGKQPEKLSDTKTIWLPNEIVSGTTSGETPPAERIRQTGDVMLLRLFIDLYKQQNLIENGGIDRKTYHTKFKRESMGVYAQYQLYWFKRDGSWVNWNDVNLPHMIDLTDEEVEMGKNKGADLFRRFGVLETLGLVQCVPYLFESDSDEAEIVHSLGSFEILESSIKEAAEQAALFMYSELVDDDDLYMGDNELVVPVPRHLENVQVVGVLRLRYRPQTAMTSAWWASFNDKGKRYLEQYLSMVETRVGSGFQADLQHQG